MSEFSPIDRTVRILELLSLGRKVTSGDLYREFEGKITLRTLQRDIVAIRQAGIPLLYNKNEKKEKEWYFSRAYRRMVLPSIHKSELMSLYVLKAYLKEFKGTDIEKNLMSVIDKLEDMAPGDVYMELNTVSDIIWDQDFGAYDYSHLDDMIEKLIQVILKNQWINISYISSGEINHKTFILFPYRLFTYHGTLYLVVYLPKHKNTISLVLQRIKSIEIINDYNLAAPEFNIETFRQNRFGVFGGDIQTVKLFIKHEYAIYFRNRSWHPSQKTTKNTDGSLLLEMEIPLSPELITWILGWHEGIKVVSPKSLVYKIKDKLERTINIYK